jgi:hypothetical protein
LDGRVSPLPRGSQTAKVGAWFGNDHVRDSHGSEAHPTAGEILRKQLASKGERYTSIYGQANSSGSLNPPTMLSLTPEVRRPAAIATRGADGEPNALGRVKEAEFPIPQQHSQLSDWDYVMLFPSRR